MDESGREGGSLPYTCKGSVGARGTVLGAVVCVGFSPVVVMAGLHTSARFPHPNYEVVLMGVVFALVGLLMLTAASRYRVILHEDDIEVQALVGGRRIARADIVRWKVKNGRQGRLVHLDLRRPAGTVYGLLNIDVDDPVLLAWLEALDVG